MNSKERFIEWCKIKSINPDSINGFAYFQVWKAGRESMMDEAIQHFEEIGSGT